MPPRSTAWPARGRAAAIGAVLQGGGLGEVPGEGEEGGELLLAGDPVDSSGLALGEAEAPGVITGARTGSKARPLSRAAGGGGLQQPGGLGWMGTAVPSPAWALRRLTSLSGRVRDQRPPGG